MHPYLIHLLSDIAAAHRTEIPVEERQALTFEEEMEEIEKWVAEEPEHTFGYFCGLEVINFPPAKQLTNKEMKKVMKAFGQMMSSWNIYIDLPKRLPIPIAYKMTVDTLNRKTAIVNFGFMGFDFCTGNAPDCVFKQYCPCLKICNQGS